ncbi:MAG: hypothetical protein KFW07_03015 [Mycoplasmataceae bacterium]|nr:hypothetical protein [Mycoplasmataceae bacterium]
MGNNKSFKIINNCLYWLNADKITNYFGKTVTKNRPFLCVEQKIINKEKYYYFLMGTSIEKNERQFKNFNNFFITIKKDIINKLEKNTHFQTNIIYVIRESDINFYTPKYIGKSTPKNMINISKKYKDAFDLEICLFSFYSNKYSKWLIGAYQSNFKDIASANKKNKKYFGNTINRNVSESKTMIKQKWDKETINRIFSFEGLF